MGNEERNPNTEVEDLSQEEADYDNEALAEVQDEDLKNKLADDLGIDPEDEPDLFDKLLKRELDNRKRLSTAIKQKKSWREKATKGTSSNPQNNPAEGQSQTERPLTVAELDKLLSEREAKKELASLNLPDDIKADVEAVAKVRGISIGEAAKLPYIVSAIEEAERVKRIESATPRRTSRGNYSSNSVDPSKPLNPSDFKLDTPEGQKAWAEAKAARRQYESQG